MRGFFRWKNGPISQKAKKTESYATQNGAVSSQIFLNSSLTRRPWSCRASEWHRLEVANRGSNLIYYHVVTWYLVAFVCNTITVVKHVPQQYSWHRHEDDNSSTAHQFSCFVYRLKRSRTSPHSSGPQPGTLGTASGGGDAVDVWAVVRSGRQAPRTAAAAVSLSLILSYY